jgi:sarcosine oxidase subunit beta
MLRDRQLPVIAVGRRCGAKQRCVTVMRFVIVGGGGHGLATAYYLAKNHGITDVAVVEKGWIGSGNSGRNTAIVRSNYLFPASIAFYDHSLTLFEELTRELNFNILFSQRGVLNLANSRAAFNAMRRRVAVLRHLGVDAHLLTPAEIGSLAPALRLHTPKFGVGGSFNRAQYRAP